MQDFQQKISPVLVQAFFYYAGSFALRMVAIATKFEPNIYRVSETRLCFFVPAFLPADISNFVKIKNTFLYICVFQKFFVILQRKM